MDMSTYQKEALKTAIYPEVIVLDKSDNVTNTGFVYPALGLAGEAGEVAEKCKKIIRDHGGYVSVTDRDLLAKELGDVLWYVAVLAKEFGLDLDLVASMNLEKLASRKERGVIGGSGDER